MPAQVIPSAADRPFGTLAGRRAVVTGSSTGIGRATAIELARAGADVVVHARRSAAAADESARLVRAAGTRAEVVLHDLTAADRLAEFVAGAWQAFGGVDVWVNNAGADVLTGDSSRLDAPEKLELLWTVDVRAAILLSRLAGERMKGQGRGVIVNVGWDQADRGMEGESGELFSATKNAIMGFTRSLALSLAPEVRVNCVAPGWIRTAWGERHAGSKWQKRVLRETPLKRWGTPEDVARLVRFLASDDSAYMTGQVINVNGGAVR